jgi:hypothetical protein
MADPRRQEKGHSADHPGEQKHLVGGSEVGQVSEAGEVVSQVYVLAC